MDERNDQQEPRFCGAVIYGEDGRRIDCGLAFDHQGDCIPETMIPVEDTQ